jgi:23S rRNA (cytosine1962-C5)-methyltransferase
MYPTITLKKGKEGNAIYGHPWVFTGAVERMDEGIAHGALITLLGHDGAPLGVGTYSAKSSIAVRIFDRPETVIDAGWFARAFADAESRRKLLGFGEKSGTTGFRVVFGEADGVPGVVIDRYADTIVFQLSTAGAEALRDAIIEGIEKALKPTVIVERSDIGVRHEEGLEERVEVVRGSIDRPVTFTERGTAYLADVLKGQKTGFFLDQRDARECIQRIADGKSVLNLFSYSGAAGIAALVGGASSVRDVDSSADALALCSQHSELHGAADRITIEEADVFQFLGDHQEPEYDIVVMDPPALIKNAKDVEEGRKAYHFLNRAAIRLVKDGGVFITSSCSRFLTEDDLAFTLRRAAVQAGVRIAPLMTLRQGADHPISPMFPESLYLKTLAVTVRR